MLDIDISSSVAFSLVFWHRLPHWTWNSPIRLGCLSSQSKGSCCLSLLRAGLKTYTATSGFLCIVGDPNSGLHACAVRNLPTEAITSALNLASCPKVFVVCVFWYTHTCIFIGLRPRKRIAGSRVCVCLSWVGVFTFLKWISWLAPLPAVQERSRWSTCAQYLGESSPVLRRKYGLDVHFLEFYWI